MSRGARRGASPAVVALALAGLAACADQAPTSSDTDPTGPSTSTTLHVDVPDDTVDDTAEVDGTIADVDPPEQEAERNAEADVRVSGERYELEVFASDCDFDLESAWEVSGTATVDETAIGFSTSYLYRPSFAEGTDDDEDGDGDGDGESWQLVVYVSVELGASGTLSHFHDTAATDSTAPTAGAVQQDRPTIDASPGRLRVSAEFVDPTGILIDDGDTTVGQVTVTCT